MSPLTRREALQWAAATATLSFAGASAQPWPSTSGAIAHKAVPRVSELIVEKFHPIAFEAQVLSGLIEERMRVNLENRLLQVDQEALLSGFRTRETAGESSSFVGEHVGKFLDAACKTLRYREHVGLREIVTRVATQLIAEQERDGYLGTYTSTMRWENWDVWVHKYNLIGLLSYYELTGNPTVLATCRRIGDLLGRTFGDGPGQRNIATGLHMGMASTSVLEAMCWLYRHTGEPTHLEFCRYIVRAYDCPEGSKIVSAMLDHGSVYRAANGKAYEMLSNFNGLIDLYRLTGEQWLLEAVLRGWKDIVANQLYLTGTASAREHFQPPGQQLAMPSSDVGETCVTVTWLQLNARLLRLTGEARYGQEIERSIYNHLFAAQHRKSGDIAYYTPLVGYKEHTHAMLCCVSSGPRGLALIPQLTWGLEGDAFVIHLYTSGRAHFELQGVPVEIVSKTAFPTEGTIYLTVKPQKPIEFAVKLRVPEWTTSFEATAAGQRWRGVPGRMIEIKRTWASSTVLEVQMDLPVQSKKAGSQYPHCIAIQRGPQVLALEESVNPKLSSLHRAALEEGTQTTPRLRTLEGATQVYEIEGRTVATHGEALVPCALKLVPFAEAQHYRIWMPRADQLPRGTIPVSAYSRAALSERSLRLDPAEAQAYGRVTAEYLTDENEITFCTADPGKPGVLAQYRGQNTPGNRADPVWFSVMLDAPRAISRIVFQHGKLEAQGGWFDTSKGKPYVEVVRNTPPHWEQGSFVASTVLDEAPWEKLAEFEDYPSADSTEPPKIEDGHAFELKLSQPITIYAFRVVGHAGGRYARCAGLHAYA